MRVSQCAFVWISRLLASAIILVLLLTTTHCKTEQSATSPAKYLRWVGDSEFDAALDDSAFALCQGDQKAIQYFNDGRGMEYEGEKPALDRAFWEGYKPVESKESGLIRIRFIVNCKGETGRFRVMEMEKDYAETSFDSEIVDQLLRITKALDGWVVKRDRDDEPTDYYQYLIFKIEKGALKEILP